MAKAEEPEATERELDTLIAKYNFARTQFPKQAAQYEKQLGFDPIERAKNADDLDEGCALIERAFEELRVSVSGANASTDCSTLIIGAAVVFQTFAARIGLKLDGPKISLADVVARQEAAYSSLVKEIMIKYCTGAFVEPEVRLGMLVATSIGMVHYQNSTAAAPPPRPPPTPPPPANKPADNIADADPPASFGAD